MLMPIAVQMPSSRCSVNVSAANTRLIEPSLNPTRRAKSR
jgi:hypothetical protein